MPGPSSRHERGRQNLPIPPTQPMVQQAPNNAPRPAIIQLPPPPSPPPPPPPPQEGLACQAGPANGGRQHQRSRRPRWWRRRDSGFQNIAKMIGQLANEAYGQGARGGRGRGRGRGQGHQ
ncbi:homeobox protein engrailed-1-like [Prorops nasuta]|uniref:homeobox protein engrailed-1-like n=1 Tax=Prorops nasuta TaxID=863751 RepID=UPI0034CD840A